jgi:hypothetical protein
VQLLQCILYVFCVGVNVTVSLHVLNVTCSMCIVHGLSGL